MEWGRVSLRFPCMTPGAERFSLDLPWAVKNRECVLEVAWTVLGPAKHPKESLSVKTVNLL